MTETDTNIIVAIPEEDDYVWKISTEKIPHMTILYLSDLGSDFTRVLEFVTHACENLYRFGLSVDRRGLLGADDADVVFFQTDDYECKEITRFRNSLLQNQDIQKAYAAVDQFPQWTPHLTLGYPTSPAKPDDREYPGIRWVKFDRIAVWNQDFSGPEIELGQDRRWEVSMSDILKQQGNEFAHHGIKGMKWGVRKDRGSNSSSRRSSKVSHPASEDAKKADVARSKIKSGGTHSLSNQELQHLVNRMNLERQYANLSTQQRSNAGAKFAKEVLLNVAKQQATKLAAEAATKAVANALKP
jgi:hypothetical protein